MRHIPALFLHYGALFEVHAGMPNCLVLGSYSEAQWAAFFMFRERLIVVAEHRGGTCILGHRFSPGRKLRGRHFFRFRGRPVVVAELKGGICILGRRFIWLGVQRASFFRFRGRLVVVGAELKGGTCISGHRFHLVRSSEGGIFHIKRAPVCVR